MRKCRNQECQPQCQRCGYNQKCNSDRCPESTFISFPVIRKLLQSPPEKTYNRREQIRQRKAQRQRYKDHPHPVKPRAQCQRDLVQIVPDPDQDEDHNNRKNHIE